MKCLSVRQPWAWLLFHGKDIENRSWPSSHRGPLAIQAAAGMTIDEYEDARDFVRQFDRELACRIPDRESLVRGAVIGTVDQIGCTAASWSPWFMGPYGHQYANATELVVPVPAKGRLGFWEWDERLAVRNA